MLTFISERLTTTGMTSNRHLHRPSANGLLPRVTTHNARYMRTQFENVVHNEYQFLSAAVTQFDETGMVDRLYQEHLPHVWQNLAGNKANPLQRIAMDLALRRMAEELREEPQHNVNRWLEGVPELDRYIARRAA